MVFLEREYVTLGLRPKRLPVSEGRFNLLCTIGSGSPRVCLNAHSDTVPANGRSTPSARIEGDWLYGLGSCDDKASIAAMTTAFLDLASRAAEIEGTVDLLVSVDEEGDGSGVRSAIEGGYGCDCAIVGEPTGLDAVRAHCGLVFLKLETRGTSAHGASPWNGVSAVDRMWGLVDEVRGALAGFPTHPVVGAPSLNLGEIHSGDRPNRVPDFCEARIDIRLVPPMTVAETLEAVVAPVEAVDWAECRIEKTGEALDTPEDSPVIRAALESARSMGVDARSVGLRGWTEAESFATRLGIDAIVLGPGSIRQAHSADEFVSISQTQTAADLYAGAVERLCGARKKGT